MPKILINEKDNTSPGTPGSYANYSVLIAGYKDSTITNGKVSPDSNGVYEFSSYDDFEKTIGVTGTENTIEGITESHYGNAMAYELLKLGYTVIYKPITSVADMKDADFWEVFRDKASYDFRFVSHGLLKTSHDATAYKALKDRLAEIEADVAKLADIGKTVEKSEGFASLTAEAKEAKYEEEYARVISTEEDGDGYEGFKYKKPDGTLAQYDSYTKAAEKLTENADGKIPAQDDQQKLIDDHDKTCVTDDAFKLINCNIANLASYKADSTDAIPGRGDCIALIELDENEYVNTNDKPECAIIDAINAMSDDIDATGNGPYCALTVPSVCYFEGKDKPTKKMPGAFHYLACFMASLRSGFAEWYAAAGYTRGVSSYAIDHTSVKLGEIAINALEPRNLVDDENKKQPKFACNVIANFRGSYYLWGNRTAYALGSAAGGGDLVAHHFLNIRQLCTTIKKQLYVACRRFTFDPNSDTLWFNFVNAITPTLDLMKADQGIRDYKVLKVFTDKKATLKAKIRIIPIEAVEDFDIEVSLEDSFGDVSVTAN